MTNHSRIMVRRIYVDQHAIGEPTYFNSYKDFNLYLHRSSGYANNSLKRKKMPIVSASHHGTDSIRKYYIIERIGDKPVFGFWEHLEAFFGQKVGYFGKISTLTRREILSKKEYIEQMKEKKQYRAKITSLLLKLDTKYSTLDKAPADDQDFQKLQNLLRGDV